MKDNYPAGSYNDPLAPWNEKDREAIPFDEYELDSECEMCNTQGVTLDSKRRCQDCYEQDPDYYEEGV